MDYKRIYDELIESRKKREGKYLAHGVYTERHHIVPRCFGGTNANANVVRLTYREHVTAHALLLKIHKTGRPRWLMAASMMAVMNFDGKGQRCPVYRKHASRKFAWARRIHAETIGGKDHPGYNQDEIELWHLDGRAEVGTRQELMKRTGLPFRQIYDLVNGRRTFAKGWCTSEKERNKRLARREQKNVKDEQEIVKFLLEDDDSDFFFFDDGSAIEEQRKKRRYEPKTKTFSLFSQCGQEVMGTKRELSEKTGLSPQRINDLVSARREFCNGWALTKERAEEGRRKPGRPRKA